MDNPTEQKLFEAYHKDPVIYAAAFLIAETYCNSRLNYEVVKIAFTIVESSRTELEQLKEALRKIERFHHNGCYRCGACVAHYALYKHWPSNDGQCCWPSLRDQQHGT